MGASRLPASALDELGVPLGELVRRSTRQLIQHAIEVEVEALLGQYAAVTLLDGRQAVVRNGHLSERAMLAGIGSVAVQVPKVRDRSGSGIKFNSALVPRSVRRTPRVSALRRCPGCLSTGSPAGVSARRCRCCGARTQKGCRRLC